MYAIEVNLLTQVFGEKKVVNNISFKVQANTIHGFLGPNGAGKTTTLKSICGILPISSGSISFFGKKINYEESDYKKLFGSLIEEPTLYDDMKVEEFLSFLCHLYKLENVKKRCENVIQKLDLTDVNSRLIKNLSKGYKQRVAIAAALIHDPKIVILDEPTVGLDVSAIAKMREIILALKKDHTVLISSHILHEMELLCDEVTLINNGKIIARKTLNQSDEHYQIRINSKVDLDKVKEKLSEIDIDVLEAIKVKENLESYFFESLRVKND